MTQTFTRRALLASAAAGFLKGPFLTPARAQNAIPVRVRTLPIDEGAQAFYAQEQGFFAQLAADVGTMPTGPGIVAAVASGEIDLGFANLFAFIAAFARGSSIRVLAAGQHFRNEDSKSFVLVVRADSPYYAAKDLNGRKIGANAPVSIVAIGAKAWIDRNGGDSSTVQIVQVPFGTVQQALDSGRADAVSTIFSDLTDIKNIRALGYPTEAIGPPFIGSAWYARAAWIDADRDRARRYARALADAGQWANAHQDNSAEILMKYLHLTPDEVRSLSDHRVVYAEKLDPPLMQPLISVAARYGVISKSFAAQDMVADLG